MAAVWVPLAFYAGWLLCTWATTVQFRRLNTAKSHGELAARLTQIMDQYDLDVSDEMALDQARVLLAWGVPEKHEE